jgi:hypothetical protein
METREKRQMKFYGLHTVILATATLAFLGGCETNEDDKISQARKCVDDAAKISFTNATSAATLATACKAIIAGVATPEAYKIEYGAILIEQQKMSRIKDLVDASKSSTGGVDGINGVLLTLAFTADATPHPIATRLKNLGAASGSAGLQTVGSLVLMATVLNGLGGGFTPGDPASVNTIINNCSTGGCSPAQEQVIADSALAFQASACASEEDQNSTDPNNLCNKAKGIIGGATTPSAIVDALAAYAATPH